MQNWKVALIAILFIFSNLVYAADEIVTLTVKTGQSLRQIADEYLGDADLWPYILTENHFESAADVLPGVVLKIPVKQIRKAHDMMEKAAETMREAADLGGQMFASEKMGKAISVQNEAKTMKKNGDWDKCYLFAKETYDKSVEIIKICKAQTNVPSEAKVDHRVGQVDRKAQAAGIWIDAPVETKLFEGDRVRTLSKSLADILFQNKSRLRLSENSEALIQTVRSNKLKKREKSTVSLLAGDFQALLGGGKNKEDFNLELANIETKINSSRFRVSKEQKSTAFSNYEGELEISASGATVKLEANEGSVVKKNTAPTKPKALLPKPDLISPENGDRVNSGNLTLTWGTVKDASVYLVEVAEDREFNRIEYSSKVLTNKAENIKKLQPGGYTWRVSAIDIFGLTGPSSNGRSFFMIDDNAPPFLLVSEPQEGDIVKSKNINFVGETEADVVLTVNGVTINVNEKGKFSQTISLNAGNNDLEILAVDPSGLKTEKKISVKVLLNTGIPFEVDNTVVQLDQYKYVTPQRSFTLSASTLPGASVACYNNDSRLAAVYADPDGKFILNLPMFSEEEKFDLEIISVTNDTANYSFDVISDNIPPEINLDIPLPRATSEKELSFTGYVKDAVELSINDKIINYDGEGKFTFQMPLKPGTQKVRITAYDNVRNVAVLEQQVMLDTQPPTIEKVSVTPLNVSGGENVVIEVQASDEGGLKKLIHYEFQAGTFKYNGYLSLQSKNIFRGNVTIPENVKGRAKITKLKVEDRLGNSTEKNY